MLRARASALALPAALLFACKGTIGDAPSAGPSGDPVAMTPPGEQPPPSRPDAGPRPDSGPPPCEPAATAVPKLLRLSNHEYRNMVSDVLGVPVDEALFARWTPVAEVYGFDTMSETRVDAQGLEEQVATAESLARLVIATPALTAHCPAVFPQETPACELEPSYSARDDFSDTQGRECWTYLDSSGAPMIFDNTRSWWRKEPDQTVLLWRDGAHPGSTVDAVRRWTVPVTGTVKIAGTFADADPGGGDGVLVVIRRGGTEVFSRDLPNGGSTPYDLTLELTRGETIDFVVHRKDNPNYDTTGFTASIQLTPRPRKAAWTWAGCAEPLVRRLASRAFRRPIRDDELRDYQSLYQRAFEGAAQAGFPEPVDEALQGVLEAVFLSPNLVFKPELVPNGVEPAERGYAVAAKLGLYARGSVPDDELWRKAGAGGLETDAQIRAEAERLLDASVGRFATNFGGQWLAFRDPGAPGPLEPSTRKESLDVFSAVLSEGLLPEKLIRPGFTIVDAPLAAHYGLTRANGDRIVTGERGGLLSQAAFLMRTANGSEFRRPIHRGLWVLTRLMCRSLPRLDRATLEEIGMSFGSIDQSLPLPEQMAIHRSSQTRCGGCHSQMDPIGLALEKYDKQGLWRETYPNGAPIVTALELNGHVVHDPPELAEVIETSPEFRACVATKLLTFALNRGPQDGERCVAQRIGAPLDGSKPTLKTMTIEALMRALELTRVQP